MQRILVIQILKCLMAISPALLTSTSSFPSNSDTACCINTWQPSICRDVTKMSKVKFLAAPQHPCSRAVRRGQLAVLKSALCRCAWPVSTYLLTCSFSCGSWSICRLLRTTTSPAAKNFKAISRPIPTKCEQYYVVDMIFCSVQH